YMEVIEGTNSLRMNETVGSTSPFHATAIGSAIVAYLPSGQLKKLLENYEFKAITKYTITDKENYEEKLGQVRKNGYSIDDQEIVIGARCVASPIFNRLGNVEGAISMSGAEHRYSPDKIHKIELDIKSAAQRISRKL